MKSLFRSTLSCVCANAGSREKTHRLSSKSPRRNGWEIPNCVNVNDSLKIRSILSETLAILNRTNKTPIENQTTFRKQIKPEKRTAHQKSIPILHFEIKLEQLELSDLQPACKTVVLITNWYFENVLRGRIGTPAAKKQQESGVDCIEVDETE